LIIVTNDGSGTDTKIKIGIEIRHHENDVH